MNYQMMKLCDFVIHKKTKFIQDLFSGIKYFTWDFRIHNNIFRVYHSN